jgi:A/G-specific adenine glycosylase
VAFDRNGAVYLVRRPEKGLLGAMLQPPLGAWRASFPDRKTALAEAPFTGAWSKKPGFVRHGFTHFELEMEVYVANFRARPNGEGRWLSREEVRHAALPTVMRKLIEHALDVDAPLLAQLSSARTC